MTWNEYYDKCSDWAISTQVSKISQLTDFGPSDQVWEIAQDYMDGKAASRLIRKAVAAGVHFTGEEIEEMLYYADMDSVNQAVKAAALPLTEDQIFTIQGIVDDDILAEVARESGVNLDADEFEVETEPPETSRERRKRHRKEFWTGAAETMMIDLFIDDFFGKGKDK